MTKIVETDVLIVGAGPSGAICSLLLANAGVRNIIINKHPSSSPGPRSHITNQRAMEILRDLGLEEAAKLHATPQNKMGHVFATSLTGKELGRIYSWATHPLAKAAHELASPCSVCDLPQLYFEPLILTQCMLRGSDVRFHTEYLSHEQDAKGVRALLRDRLTGEEYRVHAKYLVGADGARSKVAQDIELQFEGQMALGNSGSLNIEFTADLSEFVAHRPSDMFWLLQSGNGLNGTGVGVLRMVRPWNKWVGVWGYELSQGAPELNDDEAKAVVQRLIGTDRIPITIDAQSTWTINQQYAVHNTKGRVFCIGDAVHRHTPMAGLGLNTSIQDAYNLAWKLALVVKGVAAPPLLASYDAERSPIARKIVSHAFACLGKLPPIFEALGLPHAPTEADLRHAVSELESSSPEAAARRDKLRVAMDETIMGFGGGHGVEMNQRYTSSAIYPDGTSDPGFVRDPAFHYQASTRPGAHLPHAWLTKDQRPVSTLDLCGQGKFTLLTGKSGKAWQAAAKRVSQALGIEIVVRIIGPGQEYEDSWGDYRNVSEVGESGALLVRPDMFIAWRAQDASQDMPDKLLDVMCSILSIC